MDVPLTPLELIRRTRRLYGGREAIVDGPLRLTYSQLFDRCDRWSQALQQLGVEQGDRVAYIAPNTHALLEAFVAVPQIGAVLVPINYRLAPWDFADIINHCGAKVVCVDAEYLDAVAGIRDQLREVRHVVALGGTRDGWLGYNDAIDGHTAEFRRPSVGERDLLTINYTSGTTARSKGVMITHRNAYMNIVGTLIHEPMTCADRYLWTLPMFHANGWGFAWIVTAVGATHVCLRRVDPAMAFEIIEREQVTMLCAAPTVLISLVKGSEAVARRPRPGLRVLTAGAPPAAATIRRIEDTLGWKLTHFYGLTETTNIALSEPRPEHDRLGADERASLKARQGVELVSSGELTVVGADGREVPHDGQTLGEIVVRGNVVMEGYYHDPAGTAEALRGGWFHTGDGAVVHPDGYIQIRDRFKDVIISGGENISSVEVEGVLMRHPAVLEAAVVGIPDARWGEVPHGFVVLRSGASTSEGELMAFAREHLAHFKAPRGFTFVADLPRTVTGKVQKFLLRSGRPAVSAATGH